MHSKNDSSDSTYRKGRIDLCIQTTILLTKVVNYNSAHKSCQLQYAYENSTYEMNDYHLQYCIQKVCTIVLVHTLNDIYNSN